MRTEISNKKTYKAAQKNWVLCDGTAVPFDAKQIEEIIDKVVPLIAAEEDREFFRGVLFIKAESCRSSAEFASFISKLLK